MRAGTHTNRYVCCARRMLSYTALQGMHVLRVQRDDEWCALMLRVSHDIYKRFVLDTEAFVKQDVLFGTNVLDEPRQVDRPAQREVQQAVFCELGLCLCSLAVADVLCFNRREAIHVVSSQDAAACPRRKGGVSGAHPSYAGEPCGRGLALPLNDIMLFWTLNAWLNSCLRA